MFTLSIWMPWVEHWSCISFLFLAAYNILLCSLSRLNVSVFPADVLQFWKVQFPCKSAGKIVVTLLSFMFLLDIARRDLCTGVTRIYIDGRQILNFWKKLLENAMRFEQTIELIIQAGPSIYRRMILHAGTGCWLMDHLQAVADQMDHVGSKDCLSWTHTSCFCYKYTGDADKEVHAV